MALGLGHEGDSAEGLACSHLHGQHGAGPGSDEVQAFLLVGPGLGFEIYAVAFSRFICRMFLGPQAGWTVGPPEVLAGGRRASSGACRSLPEALVVLLVGRGPGFVAGHALVLRVPGKRDWGFGFWQGRALGGIAGGGLTGLHRGFAGERLSWGWNSLTVSVMVLMRAFWSAPRTCPDEETPDGQVFCCFAVGLLF